MPVNITLTPEQLATLTSGVNTIEIGETHAKEIVEYLMSERGETEQREAQRLILQNQRDTWNASQDRYNQRDHKWVDEQLAKFVTLRKLVIKETADLAMKTLMENQKENIASVAAECTVEFKKQLPEILLRSYAAQFQHVMQGALNNHSQPFINIQDIAEIKNRLGML